MMKKLLALTVLVFMVLSVCSCRGSYIGTETPNDSGSGSDNNNYISIIDLLEGEIEQLKKDQLKSTAEYEAAIAELEKQIAELMDNKKPTNNENPSEKTPFTYDIKENAAVITGYSGDYSVLVIPETIDGYPVSEIADNVFSGKTKLSSVYVPKGVKKIGWFAFSGCTSLKSVTLPESVEEIGYDAFAYCSKLTLHCVSGSYSEKFAQSYGIGCVSN